MCERPRIDINRQDLRRLQQDVDGFQNFPWGSPTSLPADRSRLKDVTTVNGQSIGEGTRVRVRAYYMHANFSNASSGENVTCDRTGQANNDIHIYLGMTPGRRRPLREPEFGDQTAFPAGCLAEDRRPGDLTEAAAPDHGAALFRREPSTCRLDKRHNPARFTSSTTSVCKFKSASSCPLNNTTA